MNGIEMSERNEKGKFYKNFLEIRHEILEDLEKDLSERERRFWEEIDLQIKKLGSYVRKMEGH